MKKITIGLPNATGDTRNDWSVMLAGMCSYLTSQHYDIELVTVDRSFIDMARNVIAEIAIGNDSDYLFFLDADTYIDLDGVDKMVKLDKDIVSPPVADRKGNKGLNIVNEGLNKLLHVDETKQVTGIGMACTLIKREVLVAMAGEYQTPFEFSTVMVNDKKVNMGEDIGYCVRANEKFGFETWCIRGIKTTHLGEPKKYTYEG